MINKPVVRNLFLSVLLLAACQPKPPAGIPVTGGSTMTVQPGQETILSTETAERGLETAPAGNATQVPTNLSPGRSDSNNSAVDDIVVALQALAQQSSFHVEQAVVAPEGNTTNQIDIIPPDRFHMVNTDMEMVIIEDTAYVLVDGQWMQFPGSAKTLIGNYIFLRDNAAALDFRNMITEAVDSGQDSINGEKVRLFEFSLTDSEDGGTINGRLWVAESDGLPRRQELIVQGRAKGNATMDLLYTDFNTYMRIELPEMPGAPKKPSENKSV